MNRTNIICLLLAATVLGFAVGQASQSAQAGPSTKALAKKYAKKYAKVYAKKYAKRGPRGPAGPSGSGSAAKVSVYTATFQIGMFNGHGAAPACQPGQQAVGGGADPFTPSGAASYFTSSAPVGNPPTAWKTLVHGTGGGIGTAYVVCLS